MVLRRRTAERPWSTRTTRSPTSTWGTPTCAAVSAAKPLEHTAAPASSTSRLPPRTSTSPAYCCSRIATPRRSLRCAPAWCSTPIIVKRGKLRHNWKRAVLPRGKRSGPLSSHDLILHRAGEAVREPYVGIDLVGGECLRVGGPSQRSVMPGGSLGAIG